MARPRYDGEIHRLQLTLCLREGEDDDLIAYLVDGDIGPRQRAQAVMAAMRRGIEPSDGGDYDVDEEEVLTRLDDMFFG